MQTMQRTLDMLLAQNAHGSSGRRDSEHNTNGADSPHIDRLQDEIRELRIQQELMSNSIAPPMYEEGGRGSIPVRALPQPSAPDASGAGHSWSELGKS